MVGTAGIDIAYVGPRISLAQGGKSANGDRGARLAHYNIKRKQIWAVPVFSSIPQNFSNQVRCNITTK
jgi:hypothetical protein